LIATPVGFLGSSFPCFRLLPVKRRLQRFQVKQSHDSLRHLPLLLRFPKLLEFTLSEPAIFPMT
jgi:hypothetical protein